MAGSLVRALAFLLLLASAGGCAHVEALSAAASEPEAGDSLTRVIADLRMHLRDDTYRQPRPRTSDGRDLFEAIGWKLDRMQRERGLDPERWQNTDFVIEFARARVLEKQRRYAEAQAAYARVAARSSALQQSAREGEAGMARLMVLASAEAPAGDEIAGLEQRVRQWSELAWDLRNSRWEPLAREEAEAWEMLRVERLATAGQLDAAIEAGEALAEHNRHSKLYARHLIALGDLHADAARALEVEKRTRAGEIQLEARRDALLERAFSAYELASEARTAEDRLAALARIEALRADREGGLAHAP
jgi:hypothetical protein